jgi:tetratricopeptide (TPR) repeat protein
MLSKLLRYAICIAALSTSGFSLAQDKMSADQIVQRHIQALGGLEKIHALHSLVIRGIYHEPGEIPASGPALIPDAYQAFLRPYYEAIGDPADKNPDIREGFDGSAWEYYGNPGIVVRTVGAAAAATRHASEFLQDSLVDYVTKGTRIDLEGTEKIAERNAYKLRVTLSDGFEKILFVDAGDFLIAAERKAAPIHAFGDAVKTETRFSDYCSEGGVMMNHRTRETEIATGKVLNEFRTLRVEVNTLNDTASFSPAPYTRTPLQQLLEQLYMERTDPVSVLDSYRQFRAANPGWNTHEGVEFIGYQMAKMGDYHAAIELLRANAADYPRSSSAQYGLGRAYKAAGDLEHARAAFQKALQIDPAFKKASDGLNALR